MSVIFVDGTSHYSPAQITRKWGAHSGASISSYGPRSGASSILLASGDWLRSVAFSALTNRIVLGYRHYHYMGSGRLYLMSGTTVQLTLEWDTDGSMTLYRGTESGTELASAAAGTLPSDGWAWNYVEIDATIDDSTGAVEVCVNGSTVDDLTVTSEDTQPDTTTGVDRFQLNCTASQCNFTDFYVDTDTLNGDCAVYTLRPSAAGASTDFVPSAGDNYENADDDSSDDDGSYNSSTDQGDKDTFAFEDLPALGIASTILAVAENVTLRKDDASTRQLKPVIRIGSTDYPHATAAEAISSYAMHQRIWTVNPDDAAAFEDADVNNAEFGYEQSLVS